MTDAENQIDKRAIEKLIVETPFTNDERLALVGDLEKGVPPEEVIEKMTGMLIAKGEEYDRADPGGAWEYVEITRKFEEALKNILKP